MESPMHNLLTHLIDEGGEGGVPVQIQFQLGQPTAGGLKKGPVDGIFMFTTALDIGDQAPPEVRERSVNGKLIVNQYFEPSSVAQVIVQDQTVEPSRIVMGGH
jgi:hypothetical protein